MVATTTRKRKGNGIGKEPVRRSKRARRLLLDDASDGGDSCPEWCRAGGYLWWLRGYGHAVSCTSPNPLLPSSRQVRPCRTCHTFTSYFFLLYFFANAFIVPDHWLGRLHPAPCLPPLAPFKRPAAAPQCKFWLSFVFATCANFGSPEELVAAMAILPESTAHALWVLNAHQSCRRHEYIKFSKRHRVEEMGSEASSDGKDGSGMAGEE